MSAKSDPFVTVTTASGSVEAEMIQDVLRQEGIESTIQGALHAGMLGAAGVLLRVPVQVPASRAEEAKHIIAALDRYDAIVEEEGEIPTLGAEEAEVHRARLAQMADGKVSGAGAYRAGPSGYTNRPYPRRKGVAFFSSFLFPGGGHFHARAHRTALALAATLVLCGVAVFGGEWRALVSVAVLALSDAIGSLAAVERFNRNTPSRSRRERAQRSLPFVAITLAFVWAIGPFIYSRIVPTRAAAPYVEQICAVVDDCLQRSGTAHTDLHCRTSLIDGLAARSWTPQEAERCARCVTDSSVCVDLMECERWCPSPIVGAPGASR